MRKAIGIDLGGTKIQGALLAEDGTILSQARALTGNPESESEVLQNLYGVVQKLLPANEAVVLGVGCAGPVDFAGQVVISSPNLPFQHNYPLQLALQDQFHLPTWIENDVKVGAIGEWQWGAGRGLRDFFFIALGTGIAGATISDGRLVRGSGYAAGEIGHLTLAPFGPRCGCGKHGCFEALAGGPAIARYVRYALERGRDSELCGLPPEQIEPIRIAAAARHGDRLAMEAFSMSAHYTGLALSYVTALLNPGTIIIGGGLADALDLMQLTIQETLVMNAFAPALKGVTLVSARLGNQAGMIGAAMLALQQCEEGR
jgi:glucokinase